MKQLELYKGLFAGTLLLASLASCRTGDVKRDESRPPAYRQNIDSSSPARKPYDLQELLISDVMSLPPETRLHYGACMASVAGSAYRMMLRTLAENDTGFRPSGDKKKDLEHLEKLGKTTAIKIPRMVVGNGYREATTVPTGAISDALREIYLRAVADAEAQGCTPDKVPLLKPIASAALDLGGAYVLGMSYGETVKRLQELQKDSTARREK
ncbi:MAG: hypothetical protein HY514_03860 [Candidatus Aenigmarchaeota archaeon]|nr:hypothetical protein [Candidatus Aenigmarchaeota archaeon]